MAARTASETLTHELMLAGTTQSPYKNEDQNDFLARITHLSVTGRGIRDMSAVSICANLSVLFLYDNKIETIYGLEACPNLTRLYLQNNAISIISGLDSGKLARLTVLNLNGNRIKTVSGLHQLPALEELSLDKQKLDKGESLEFDLDTIAGLSTCLKKLSLIGNNIFKVLPFGFLQELEYLDLSGNAISDIEELEHMALNSVRLQNLRVVGNPMQDRYLRQRMVLSSNSLVEFNGKTITDNERMFLQRLDANKAAQAKQASRAVAAAAEAPATLNVPSLGSIQSEFPAPIPHLPPYASQYRDMILHQMGKQNDKTRANWK